MKKWSLLSLLLSLYISTFAHNPVADNGTIKGKVTTSDNSAANGVTIQLLGKNKSTLTNDGGEFILRNIAPGHYTLEASLVGYTALQQEIDIQADEKITANFTFPISAKELTDVVVMAQRNKYALSQSDDVAKMPLKNMENPQVYTTVTSSLMVDQGAFNLDQALRNVPGITQLWSASDRSGFGNGSSFALRGFQINTYLRNGIPANVSTTMDNANIESVEVLKGPSATLFGSAVTAYGGLINRVPKKPYDHPGGEISYSGGSFGFNRLAVDVNTPLDSAKKLLFRINTTLNTKNSWQDAGYHKNIFIAPSVSYQANDRLSFSFDAELYASKGTTPQIFFFDASTDQLGVSSADKLNLDYKRSYISNDLAMSSSNLNFSGQMKYKLSDNWTSQTNISLVNTQSNGPMPYLYLEPGNDTLARNVWTIDGSDKTLDIQQNFVGNFNIGSVTNRLLLGLDYYHYSSDVLYHEYVGTVGNRSWADLFDVINSTGYIPNYLNFNKAKVDSAYANSPASPSPYILYNKQYITSAYVSDVANITDNLIINAAIRVDHFHYSGDFDPLSGITSGGYNQTSFSPKFGLVYQVIKDKLSLFGNYQNGFTNETGKDFQGKSFKPEQANQLEGGIKMDLFGGKLSGSLSYYDIKVKDVLRADVEHVNFQLQDGTQISKGLEADITANPFSGLNIVAGYAHNQSKYTQANTDVDGRRPNNSGPEEMANLWISYRLTSTKLKGLGIGFGGNYAGKSLVQNSVSLGQFYLPEYTLVNSTLFYETSRMRFGVTVNNLTNKRYWIGWTTVNPQEPRSIQGTVSFKF